MLCKQWETYLQSCVKGKRLDIAESEEVTRCICREVYNGGSCATMIIGHCIYNWPKAKERGPDFLRDLVEKSCKAKCLMVSIIKSNTRHELLIYIMVRYL
jgi:hypothetical protein